MLGGILKPSLDPNQQQLPGLQASRVPGNKHVQYEDLLILDMLSGFTLEIPASISIAVHIFDDICIITVYSQPSLDISYFTKW